jgi:hypothetical protein
MTEGREPQGIIAIFTAPDGDVIATATDFNRSGMGGCKLWEAQMYRATDAVKGRAATAYTGPALDAILSNYTRHKIAEELCAKGHKISVRAIGWGDEVDAEIRLRR